MVDGTINYGVGDVRIAEYPLQDGERLLGCHDDRTASLAGGNELERKVGGLGVEGAVADRVDDNQGRSLQLARVGLQAPIVLGRPQLHHPLGAAVNWARSPAR